ncbi:hypothetical protein HMPREF9134_01282 [Porphyromonas catoniae F0037]|uniref:Uncharacterized protein n=1 Tax=Porphyromonas catoniae F0037 TaxID=1127696 RepID=L1NBQ1_9PORP|nr:hypothetical protein HMPREF9134_01282 [Porphyromonas catoniae F0037]
MRLTCVKILCFILSVAVPLFLQFPFFYPINAPSSCILSLFHSFS